MNVRHPSALPVEAVVATDELDASPPRAPDYQAQGDALAELAETLATDAGRIFDRLVRAALSLTGAESAGLSLQEGMDTAEPHFRWVATAGEFERYLGGKLPRFFSPCGSVVGWNAPVLMRDPVRAFPYVADLHVPCREVLLAPFHKDGEPIGTLWAVHHTPGRRFDAEDRRVLVNLSRFAAVAVHTTGTLESLRRAMEELRQADRAKDELVAIIAHELRNPLSPIKVAVQVLKRTSVAEHAATRTSLEIIDRQATNMAAMIDGLMDATAMRTGKIVLAPSLVNLQDVAARSLEAVQEALSQRKHRLSVSLPPEPVTVTADGLRLTQALTNLLGNAAKYTPQGGAVELTLVTSETQAAFEIRDNGEGIAPELLPGLFNMFVQGGRYRHPASGLGIGLTLANKIMELHGGGITAESAGMGKGSTFRMWLPRSA